MFWYGMLFGIIPFWDLNQPFYCTHGYHQMWSTIHRHSAIATAWLLLLLAAAFHVIVHHYRKKGGVMLATS
jgi:hypothetical protein